MKLFLLLTLTPLLLSTAALADPAAPSPDPMALLTAASNVMSKAHSFTADMVLINSYPPKPGKTKRRVFYAFVNIECRRPNFARERTWFDEHDANTPNGQPPFQLLSDGKVTYIIDGDKYGTRPLKSNGSDAADDAETLVDFFSHANSQASLVQGYQKSGRLHFLRLDSPEQWNGATYTVVEYEFVDDEMLNWLSAKQKSSLPNGKVITTVKCYIGADGLIDRTVERNNMDWTVDARLSNIKIDPPIQTAEFVLPKGLSERKEVDNLLPNGIDAPDFTVLTSNGKPARLSDYRGSVVVIDFWATWCGPCQESLPGVQKIAAKYRRRGVVTLAINVWDRKAAFDDWLPEHTQYSALTILRDPTESRGQDVATRLYHVSGIPTQYVIDRQGKLVAHFVGYSENESGLESAIISAL